MYHAYNNNKMSVRAKVVCERGKFFIRTGTSSSFHKFMSQSAGEISKYIPDILINRIVDLINSNDIDSAILLWEKACYYADKIPSQIRRRILFYVSYIIIASMAIYAFIESIF